jgi:hypothetical protein
MPDRRGKRAPKNADRRRLIYVAPRERRNEAHRLRQYAGHHRQCGDRLRQCEAHLRHQDDRHRRDDHRHPYWEPLQQPPPYTGKGLQPLRRLRSWACRKSSSRLGVNVEPRPTFLPPRNRDAAMQPRQTSYARLKYVRGDASAPDFRDLTFSSSWDAQRAAQSDRVPPILHCRPNATCPADRFTSPQARGRRVDIRPCGGHGYG